MALFSPVHKHTLCISNGFQFEIHELIQMTSNQFVSQAIIYFLIILDFLDDLFTRSWAERTKTVFILEPLFSNKNMLIIRVSPQDLPQFSKLQKSYATFFPLDLLSLFVTCLKNGLTSNCHTISSSINNSSFNRPCIYKVSGQFPIGKGKLLELSYVYQQIVEHLLNNFQIDVRGT